MIRRPPRSTPFPTRRSSDLQWRLVNGDPRLWGRDGDFNEVKVDPKNAEDRKSTRLNSSHGYISYAVFCLKKKKNDVAVGEVRGAPATTHGEKPVAAFASEYT